MARVEGIPDEKKRSVALTLPRIPIKICYTRPQSEINYMSMEIEFGDIGNYQLLQQIGRGRYSQVFDALDRRTDTQVVIKKLLTMDMRKIRRELIYLDILRPGPNIIKSSDTLKMDVRADGFTFGVVFEKVQNIDYRILYRQLDDFQIRYYLYQLLKALEYAHLRGIMHRDVKPGNIVIDHPKKILRLIDWGFGAMYFPGQSYYCGACTLPYRAPELLLGYRLYHYAVDMWSFGCVAAGMIFRRDVFFEGIDERTTLQSIGRLLGRSKLDEYLNKYFIRSSTAQSIPESCEGLRLEAFLRPENQETATCTAMSMLRQVLVYDHQERLTAGEARKHPYFLSLKQGHVHYKRPRQCESAGHVAGQAAPAAYRPMVDDANAGPRPEERAGAAAGPSSGNAGAGPGTHSRDAVAGPGTHSRDAVAGTGTHSSDAGAGPGTHSRHTGAGPGTHSRDTGAGPGRHSRDADDSDDDADDGTRAGARKRPRPRARAGAKKKNEETASEIDELPDIDPNFASALEAALSREVGARQRRSSPNEPEPSNQTDTSESFEYNAAEDSFFDEEDNTFDYMETPEDDPDPNCASSNANAPVEDPEELPRDGEGSDERDQDPPQAEHPPLDEDPPQAEHSPLDEDPPQAEQSPLDEDPPQAEHSPLDEDPPQAEHSPLDEDPAQNEDLSQALPAREENPAHDEDRSRDQDPLRHEDPFRNGDPPRSEDPSRDANSSRDENPPQNEDPQRNDNPPHNEHPQRNEAPSRNEAPQRQEHPSRDKDSPQNEDTPRNGDPSRDEDPPRFETTPQNDDPSHDENPSRKEDPSRTENPRRGEHPNDKQ